MSLLGEIHKEKIPNYDQYTVAERAKTMGTFDQRGQTCGIYALAAALKTYTINIPIIETAGEPGPKILGASSMRYEAKHVLKITKIGELFHAKDVVTLAKQYGHVAEVKRVETFNFYQTISLAIRKNRLVMIPFYPKDSGHPDPSGGTDGGHWCLAIGYFESTLNGIYKILVTHWDRFLLLTRMTARTVTRT